MKLRKIWDRHVTGFGDRTGAYRVLVGRREVKRPLVRTIRRWEDNTKKHFH
jgi:hypothetical protein